MIRIVREMEFCGHTALAGHPVRLSRSWIGLALGMALMASSAANAGKLDQEQKSANAFFKGKTFTAKVDLKHQGKHDVDPDGQPTSGKRQGRHRRDRGLFVRDISIPAGGVGKGITVRVDESDREIKVVLSPKRGMTMHFSSIYIHYERELVAADVDPRAIARALAAYVEFEGVDVGSEIDDALEQLSPPVSSVGSDEVSAEIMDLHPRLESLLAVTEPTSMRREAGAEVLLQLIYALTEATSQEPVEVIERRTLLYEGKALPGFPIETKQRRSSGQHSTTYRQPIPTTAAVGGYTFQGEVCVGGDCISRSVTFVLDP